MMFSFSKGNSGYYFVSRNKIADMVSKGDRLGGGGDALRVWDGNAIKLGCDDHCTTINVI